MQNRYTALFLPKPQQWGLRGDPFLWQELQRKCADFTPDMDIEAFERELDRVFEGILESGSETMSEDSLHFDSFPKSGLSGGLISLSWWLEKGLPLLKERYKLVSQ